MSKERILIIEDDPDIVMITTYLLEEQGYNVSSISDNIQPEQIFAVAELPDLILLDLNLPGISGHEVCSYVKSNEILASIPVILMSANIDIKAVADECGADTYIQKPFDIQYLIKTVNAHAGKSKIKCSRIEDVMN